MDSSRTVWMGNIDNKTNEQSIRKIFKSLSKKIYLLYFKIIK